MPCPPLFPEARQRAFQPLAKSRRRFAVTAAGGEQRFLIEHAQPSHHLGSGGHQVALDRGILRGPLVGGFRRRPQLLAPPGARLAQRAALVRRDAQRPGERLATGVELGCPREDLDERALRRILRFRGNWQRARRERAEDGPQGGEDRLEGSAVTIGQAAHLSLQRGARASVHFSSGTDTPSSPRSTTRSGNSPPPPTLPIPRALPGRAPEASTSSCASSCLLCGLLL